MAHETPIRRDLQNIIDASLTQTKEWGWDDDDRKWSACGTVQKYIEAHSELDGKELQAVIIAMVEQAMNKEQAI